MYTEEILKRFKNPEHMGKIKSPDGVGEKGNVRCGDVMKVYIKVKKNRIAEAKFETWGCPAAIASSDALCELAKGKTIAQAEKITNKDIVKKLGGKMPAFKLHCSVLGMQTLKKAIEDYKKKH